MKLVTSREKHAKYIIKPNVKNGYSFLKELFAAKMKKTKIKMNKAAYLGEAILNLTKTLM